MLRDKNLIPLSHQHQRALALCVRIDRAQPIAAADLPAWQSEIGTVIRAGNRGSFLRRRNYRFSRARRFADLIPLVEELIADHAALGEVFCQARSRQMSPESLAAFAQTLSSHIRKEERQLFEGMQRSMSADELAGLGARLEAALKDVAQSCAVPNKTTRLRASR